MSKTIYGRAAYEGFAKAIGAKLGLRVTVEDGASACIDAAGTIQLPGMNKFQTAREFAITCGTLVHELSHQFYRSHKLIDPNRDRLEHDCLNAALDVADETWVAAWFEKAGNARPGELLTMGNEDALSNQALYDWSNPAGNARRVLCAGIIGARVRNRTARRLQWRTAHIASQYGVDAKACYRLLRSARLGSKQRPNPTRKRFPKLLKIAKRLAEILKPFTPPPSPEGAAAQPSAGAGKGLTEALGQGTDQQPKGTRLASEQDGAGSAEGGANGQGASGKGAGTSGDGSDQSVSFDQSTYAMLMPAVSKVAQRIATDGDGISAEDGLSSGSRIGQAFRLATDGQCLGRWEKLENADGVAVSVVLDCSGSMNHHLYECAGIARAFAQGMRQAGDVQSIVFGSQVEDSNDFANVRPMGGTNTGEALAKSLKWLRSRTGQRWIVLVTDGQPGNPAAVDQVCYEAAAAGVRLLVVGLGCTINMPHASAVVASDAAHLAIELDAAAQRIDQPA